MALTSAAAELAASTTSSVTEFSRPVGLWWTMSRQGRAVCRDMALVYHTQVDGETHKTVLPTSIGPQGCGRHIESSSEPTP